MTDHLTETEVSLFRERTIRPTERERIDSHVAECESCLRRILPTEDSALVYRELTEALLPDSADEAFHLSNAEVRRYANGSIDQADRVIFESHFDICDLCSEAVQSLIASPLVETLSYFVLGVLSLIAAHAIIDHQLEPASFLQALFGLAMAGASLKPLTAIRNDLEASAAAAERVDVLMRTPPEPGHDSKLPRLPRHAP